MRYLSALALLVWAALNAWPAIAGEKRSMNLQGVQRVFWIHNAEAAEDGPKPAVISLHGFRRKDEAAAARDDFSEIAWPKLDEIAAREAFLTVYPTAVFGQWSLFDGLKDAVLENGDIADDVRLIRAILKTLFSEGLADPARVYLTGNSDGAIMAYRVLCEGGNLFAAAAPTSGTMYGKHHENCAVATPAPLMLIAGTQDTVLPYDGWIFRGGREVSVPETMEHWRNLHGCTGQESKLLEDRAADDGSRVRLVSWTGCAREGGVKLYRVEGGGHNRPSFAPPPPNPSAR